MNDQYRLGVSSLLEKYYSYLGPGVVIFKKYEFSHFHSILITTAHSQVYAACQHNVLRFHSTTLHNYGLQHRRFHPCLSSLIYAREGL